MELFNDTVSKYIKAKETLILDLNEFLLYINHTKYFVVNISYADDIEIFMEGHKYNITYNDNGVDIQHENTHIGFIPNTYFEEQKKEAKANRIPYLINILNERLFAL